MIIPTFVELTSSDVEENKVKLAEAGVTFPIGQCVRLLVSLYITRLLSANEINDRKSFSFFFFVSSSENI